MVKIYCISIMETDQCKRTRQYGWAFLHLVILSLLSRRGSCQVRYSIQEELPLGTVVGNVAKDIGLDTSVLVDRNLRIVTGTKQELFQVNQRDGSLFVNQRIDREELCGKTTPCYFNLKAVTETPLEMHRVSVEILDINDHSPSFPTKESRIEIYESATTGTRFQLEAAIDPDVGVNGLRFYKLSHSEYFKLEIHDRNQNIKIPFLTLQKPVDRELKTVHKLSLVASDDGSPQRSDTLNITVTVLDVNDNAPVCNRQEYTVSIQENVQIGTLVAQINATDLDDGANGEVTYTFINKFSSRVSQLFHLDEKSGKIEIKGLIDFEENQIYDLNIQASDGGTVPFSTQCNVFVKVEDVNDNTPEIHITSLSNQIPENAPVGTVVALIGVTDLDSGKNGQVVCTLPEDMPFDLKHSSEDNFYSLVTKNRLDRELVPQYEIIITARDLGSPSLSSVKTIRVELSDVNDNSPVFSQSPYTFYIMENNDPGASIFKISASDADESENALISYSFGNVPSQSVTSFLNINSDSGDIYALKSFDFETMKTFHFQVVAKDSGTPSLSSNVTVNVFILDQNDNAPLILSPVSTNGSTEGLVELSRNTNVGHLVTKVRAYDPDIGYNGWLSFSLQQLTDPSLFGLERYTGEIRTLRPFTETDKVTHKLVVLVKDNGNISLSATATMVINAVEAKEAFSSSDIKRSVKKEEENNITLYLMISLASVSALFVFSIIGLIVLQCSKPPDYSSKYSRDSNCIDTSGNGTLCHSIQYRSGEKRYMLVGPRMSIGSAIVPGSNGNTLVVHEHSKRISGEKLTLKEYGAPKGTKEEKKMPEKKKSCFVL